MSRSVVVSRGPRPHGAVGVMVAAGALWGSTFAVPVGLPATSPLVLTGGRFVGYGVLSAVLLVARRGSRRDLPWGRALAHAATGWVGMYLAEVLAIHRAGPVVTVSVIGTLPVAYALVGARRDRAPLAELVPSVGLVALGHLCLHVRGVGDLDGVGPVAAVTGALAAAAGVAGWCWFALDNADLLRRRPDIGEGEWSSAVGVACAFVAAPLLVVAAGGGGDVADPPVWVVAAVVYLAVGPSWLAGAAWNRASLVLPRRLAGQLIVFEPLFAFAFVSLATGHRPDALELVGEACLLAGALVALGRRARGVTAASASVPPAPTPSSRVAQSPGGSKTAMRDSSQSPRASGAPGSGAGVIPQRTITRSEAGTHTMR